MDEQPLWLDESRLWHGETAFSALRLKIGNSSSHSGGSHRQMGRWCIEALFARGNLPFFRREHGPSITFDLLAGRNPSLTSFHPAIAGLDLFPLWLSQVLP
jgi:hypothetical protein